MTVPHFGSQGQNGNYITLPVGKLRTVVINSTMTIKMVEFFPLLMTLGCAFLSHERYYNIIANDNNVIIILLKIFCNVIIRYI